MLPYIGHAQLDEFIKPSGLLDNQLTDGQKDFRQRMLDGGQYSECQTISTEDIQNFLVDGKLDFKIPGLPENLEAEVTREEKGTSPYYDFLWSGKIKNEHPGEILIMQKENLIGGFIQISQEYYAIFPIDEKEAFLMKHNPLSPPLKCGNDKVNIKPPKDPEVNPCKDNFNECEAVIDALVLVTPEARAFFSGISNNPFIATLFISFALQTPNIAFGNSDIPNKNLRITLTEFNFAFNNPANIVTDINNLTNDPAVQGLRDDFRADVVIMLSNQNYTQFGATLDGKGYSIVEVSRLWNPNWTLAHEVGHLLEGKHNRTNNGGDNDVAICSHAWRFTDAGGAVHRTATGTLFNDETGDRILHYSNPDIMFNGVATGTVNDDNARTIRNTACSIAVHYPQGSYFAANILAPSPVCVEEGDFTALASVNEAAPALPGHPPFTYNWSVNGCGSTVSPQGDGSLAIIPFECFQNGGTVNVQVTVTSADGETVSGSYSVEIEPEPCSSSRLQDRSSSSIDGQQTEIVQNGFAVYPNPVSSLLTVKIPQHETPPVVEVSDMQGRILKLEKNMRGNTLHLDFSGLPDGIYLLKLKGTEGTTFQKVLKTSH